MKATLFKCLLLGSLALLTACGGGGGSGNDGSFGPIQSARISASAQANSVPAGGTLAVSVTVSNSNNTAIADGTVVTAAVSPSTLGGVFGVVNGQQTSSNTATTVGGRAEFVFVTGLNQGSATLTFSTQPAGQPSSVSAAVPVTVTAPAATGNITIQATRTQLPLNLFGVRPFFGSPYMSELTITARTASGQPISIPRGEAGGLGVTVNPVSIAAYSTLDDPETEEINEFLTFMGQGPVNIVAGRATVFIHSFNLTGAAVVTATIQDPETGRTMTATQTINVVSSTPPLPASVMLSPTFSGLYVQGAGGPTSGAFEVDVADGVGQHIPDPVSGNTAYNNIRVEVIGDAPAAANERVNGVNAAGQSVSGQSIALRTTNGVATFNFVTGNRLGQTTVRVTADRADNNVDNGISDPVVAEHTVVISDGRLFAVHITSPFSEAILINGVTTGTDAEGNPILNPDGTYSLIVSALATDRQGNPVQAGTAIEFGLIDAPLVGFPTAGPGTFVISGNDGNPQENGFLFTAPSGTFQTSAGGAGPGDTLLVFGQSVPGNRDLESARAIAQVNSQTSLTTVQRFNRNDDTGASVDYGNALPYIIGRAQHGNIVATGFTNGRGVATVRMNYPVSRLGQSVMVWARGTAVTATGSKLVTDISGYVYPGVAPLTIIASPSAIPGNTTAAVSVCLRDAMNSPLQGAFVNFGFSLSSGIGTIGGRSSGPLPNPTGADGCVLVNVVTSGMTENDQNFLTFTLGDAEPAEVEIRVAEGLILQAFPSAFLGDGNHEVNLRLIDGAGNGIAGRAIGVACTGSGDTAIVSVLQPPVLTDASGNSRAIIRASLMDQPGGGAEWECVFSLPGGEPSATVLFKGRDSCGGGGAFSPPPPLGACDANAGDPNVLNLALAAPGTAQGGSVVTGTGTVCAVADGGSQTCRLEFTTTTAVELVITPNNGPRTRPGLSGSCTYNAGEPTTGTVFRANTGPLQPVNTCTIVFQ